MLMKCPPPTNVGGWASGLRANALAEMPFFYYASKTTIKDLLLLAAYPL
jgi:hypothetical protein